MGGWAIVQAAHPPLRGYILALAGAAGFGTLGLFSKLFYDDGGEPFALLFLRFVVTGPVLLLVAVAARDPLPSLRLTLAGLAVGIGQFGAAYGLFEGFARAPVALVLLLFYIYPLLVTLGGALLYGEELGRSRLAVVGIGLAGIALIVGVPEKLSGAGIALGLGGAVSVTAVILASRHLMVSRGLTPRWLSGLMFTGPAVGLAIAVPFRSPELSLDAGAWGWALCAVFVSAVVPISLFYTGVKLVGAGTAALLANAEPLVGVFLAYAVLGETLTALQLTGGILVIGGVVLLGLQGMRRAQARPREVAGAPP
jgi:drug/metabolite transporter (DMT)-like permease